MNHPPPPPGMGYPPAYYPEPRDRDRDMYREREMRERERQRDREYHHQQQQQQQQNPYVDPRRHAVAMEHTYSRERERDRREERDHLQQQHERDIARQVEREREYFAAHHAQQVAEQRAGGRRDVMDRERRDSQRPPEGRQASSFPTSSATPGMHPPMGLHSGMYPPPPPPAASGATSRAGSALPVRPPHPGNAIHPQANVLHYPAPPLPPAPSSSSVVAGTPLGTMPPPPGTIPVDPRPAERERDRRERDHVDHRDRDRERDRERERDRMERDRERERNHHHLQQQQQQQQQDPRLLRERERDPRDRERPAVSSVAGTPLPVPAVRAGSVVPPAPGRVGATTPAPVVGPMTTTTGTPMHGVHARSAQGLGMNGRATPGGGSPRLIPPVPSAAANGSAPTGAPPVPSVHAIQAAIVKGTEAPLHALAQANEQTWLLIGAVSEQLNDTDRANAAYEHALRHNPTSVSALTQVAGMARVKEDFHKAVDYYQRVLNISQENGEVWGSLGHCYLMMDDLQKAYTAYQQALYRLPNPKDPKLWYGIGILYDRYGSLEHAEEAFSSVLRMEPNFDKANEVYFRLGIIYKTQQKFTSSLECFRYILNNPPKPLTEVDIWFQVGHVHEQQKDYNAAKDAYERVLKDNPNHAKVLQQLGWLYHQPSASFSNQDTAIAYLTKSLEADPADAQSWYLLGRAFMEGQKYNKAYEAYQQAVYRDGKNPTFWCSIGVLYYQINQYRDALDAYSRAIRLNPFISEVWFNLGSLYESCNNQVNDAIDAYARAHDLDPANNLIKSRLNMLRNAERDGVSLTDPPPPQDVHPTAYAQTVANRAFPGSQAVSGNAPAPFEPAAPGPQTEEPQPVVNGRDLAAPPLSAQQAAAGTESAFRNGGGPPPLQITPDVRGTVPRPAPTFAPMDIDQRDRSAAPNRPAPVSLSGRSAVGEDDEHGRADRTPAPAPPHDYQSRRETPYRPGSSSGAARQEEWHRDRPDRAISSYHPSPRVSPTAMRSQPQYVSRATLDPRLETSPRSVRRSPAYDYSSRHDSGDRLTARGAEDRARANSIGRYAESPYEAERRRADESKRRDWQEQDRLREEDESLASGSTLSLRVEEAKMSSRAPSPARPASSHSRPGSSRRKKKTTKTAPVGEQKNEVAADLGKRPEPRATTPATKLASPPRARVMDEDYDEGAADALMGLAGYRGTGQGKESTYAPVQPVMAGSPHVVRLDPHQISTNVMSSSSATLKRATASSPSRENTDGREKKARYDSPSRDSANSANPAVSPARSVPSAISIPSRTVTTMIEVLNPSRVTPTSNSPMTANEMVSPSQRLNGDEDPSFNRELAASPSRRRSSASAGDRLASESRKEPDVAEPVDASTEAPVIKPPVSTSPRAQSVTAATAVQGTAPAKEPASPSPLLARPSSVSAVADDAGGVAALEEASNQGKPGEKTESAKDIVEAKDRDSPEVKQEKREGEDGGSTGLLGSDHKESEAMDTSL